MIYYYYYYYYYDSPLPQFSVVVKGEHENLKFRCLLSAVGDTIFKR